jgi:hypothetical protein
LKEKKLDLWPTSNSFDSFACIEKSLSDILKDGILDFDFTKQQKAQMFG